MDKKKVFHILISTLLPLALYILLFQPYRQERVTELTIHNIGAIKAIGIAILQLGITFFTAAKINSIPLADTGLFSFRVKNLVHIALGFLFIAFIYLAGAVLLSFAAGINDIENSLTVNVETPIWLLAMMMLAVGYYEEFFFRIYMVETMGAVLGKMPAVLLSAAFFALGHLYQGYWAVILIFFIGLGFQWIYSKYRSIHVNAIIHALFDIISILIKGAI